MDRRVQIRVALRGEDWKGFGTGYLVAPRLVLTAAHVLDDVDPEGGPYTVTVCQPDTDEREYPATVLWQTEDETVDAALVEIAADCGWPVPESLTDLTSRPPQRYGHLIGTRPQPISLTGFPAMQQHPEWGHLDEHLPGKITPGTGALAGRYEVTSEEPLPQGLLDSAGTCWSGISGAAVLADDGLGGDLLCGIVRADRQADLGTRLTVTPISHLLTDQQDKPSEFRRLITAHTGWNPVLEPIEPVRLLKPATDRDLGSPAALLRADTSAVAFHGRDKELADLRAWCTTDPAKIAIRVITGPGGQGKTRLARHLTDVLSHEGWVTGHLGTDLTDREDSLDRFSPLITALPLLVVVDYAETRPRLLRRLLTLLHSNRHRVRLLLLARSDGEWRTDALSATAPVRHLLAAAPVVPLGPLQGADRPEQDRHVDFRNAACDLARLLPHVPSVPDHDWHALADVIRPPDDLAHPRYGNVLTLQMTALVTLLQHGPRPAIAAVGHSAEEILLMHEERFWDDSAEAPGFKLGLNTNTLSAAVAVAALCGADSTDAATRVLAVLPALPAHQTARTAAWLARLYPADPDRYWGSLQPDRVAEFHAGRALTQHGVDLPALLTAADAGQQAQTVTVLARAAIAHYNAARIPDSEQVLSILDAALDTTDLPYQALQAASAAIPRPSRIVNPLAVRLTAALARAYRELTHENPAAHEPELAASLSNLGARLSERGRRAEALTTTEQAVDIYRRLAADNPAVFEPDLATSLSNLGVDLSEAGRPAEALTAEQQAVKIRRRLAAADPAAFEPGLARSLSNLGNWLSEAGRQAEALTATEEAMEIRRRLAADNPAAFEPDLAASLSNLGVDLWEVGRQAEALSATEQAVEIRRRLAADNPAAFEPDLARSLSNLGVDLSEAGRQAEALTATEQAVDIYRRLAADNPAAFEPDLARSLSNLGVDLWKAGRQAEALTATEQAVDIYRRLAADNPAAFEPDLAHSLSILDTWSS